MSDTPTPKPDHPVTAKELSRSLTWHDVRTIGTILVSVFASGVVAIQFVAHEARAQADAGTSSITKKVDYLDHRLNQHEKDSSLAHELLTRDLREVQADIRALYRYQKTGVEQPRLEKPPATDGGSKEN